MITDNILGKTIHPEDIVEKARAVSMAVDNLFNGTSRQDFEKQLIIMRMVVKSLKGGKSVTKSMVRCDQGRCGMGSD